MPTGLSEAAVVWESSGWQIGADGRRRFREVDTGRVRLTLRFCLLSSYAGKSDPPRNRTENLLIKSQLLCLIELAGRACGVLEGSGRPLRLGVVTLYLWPFSAVKLWPGSVQVWMSDDYRCRSGLQRRFMGLAPWIRTSCPRASPMFHDIRNPISPDSPPSREDRRDGLPPRWSWRTMPWIDSRLRGNDGVGALGCRPEWTLSTPPAILTIQVLTQ